MKFKNRFTGLSIIIDDVFIIPDVDRYMTQCHINDDVILATIPISKVVV